MLAAIMGRLALQGDRAHLKVYRIMVMVVVVQVDQVLVVVVDGVVVQRALLGVLGQGEVMPVRVKSVAQVVLGGMGVMQRFHHYRQIL